jgi:hypothetical protein
MSIIPQRPPDTPLLQYYATGRYPKAIKYDNFKPSNAEPGVAARMGDRNKQPNEEIQIKPTTQTKFSARHYRPDGYLKPQIGSLRVDSDVSNNNLHLNKINNRINDVNKNRANQQVNFDKPTVNYYQAKQVELKGFNTRKNNVPDSQRSNIGGMRPSRGKEIAEVMLRKVADENSYYKNAKHTFMNGPTEGNYHKTTPDYFRILDRPENQVDPVTSKGFDGTMTIVSRNQGWITVTPKNKNRKKPVEKFGVSGDATVSSKLTPNWMQCDYPKNKTDFMERAVPSTTNLRAEANRTYLVDKQQPKKSIWNLGDVRHNVPTAEQAAEFNNQAQSQNIVRMMEWKENSAQQRFDKNVTGKIGSYHG